MEDTERQIQRLNKELNLKGIGKISHKELCGIVFKGFSPYFEYPENLESALAVGILVSNYKLISSNKYQVDVINAHQRTKL